MKIITVKVGVIKTNTYIFYKEGSREAVIVDPADDFLKLEKEIKNAGVEIKAVLITHAHFDHVNAVTDFQRLGAKVYLHKNDEELIHYKGDTTFKSARARIIPFEPDIFVEDGQVLDVCGFQIKVIHTPGHSKGSVCYVVDDVIFSGDTLFYLDIGSTRFFGGNDEELQNSIKEKLFKLGKDYKVLPGHGIATSLKYEKENNPYV